MAHPRRSARIAALILCVAAASCGGRTARSGLWTLGAEPGADAARDIFDVVPAGVAYASVVDMSAVDAALLREQWRGSPIARAITDALAEHTGMDAFRTLGIEALGIDLEGETAIFSTRLAPVVIGRLADPGAFQEFLVEVQARNPDIAWSKFRLGGADFLAGTTDGNGFDAGIVGQYAVIRLRTGDPALDIDDALLSDIVLGNAGPGLRQDPRVLALQARTDLPMNAVAVVDTADLIERLPTLVERLDETGPEYVDDAQRQACRAAAASVADAIPWVGFLRAGDAETPHLQHAWYVANLGPRAQQRASALLSGTFDGALPSAHDAALYVSGNVDVAGLVDIMRADPALADCPDIGAIPGQLARAGEWLRPIVAQTPLDGLAALAVYGVDLDGMFPRIDLVLALGASDPIRVIETVQSVLETNGAVGTVDQTAPYTSVDYDVLGYRIRLLKREDRVVLTVGDVSVGLVNALATVPARVAGQPFHEATISGPRVAEILRGWYAYAAEMGVMGTSEIELFDATVAAYDHLRWAGAEGRVDGGALVVEVVLDYELPVPEN